MNPARSTTYAAIGGAFTIILNWVVSLFGLEVPGEVGQAVTLLVTTLLSHFVHDDDRAEPVRPPVDPSHP